MVQAAARGVVDFSEANLLDRKWWKKLWWLLDQVEIDNVCAVRRMQHVQHCALLSYQLEDKAFETHWEGAGNAVDAVWQALFPWHEPESKYSSLRQAWINIYGDPADPETQRKSQLTVDFLREMRAKGLAKTKKANKANMQAPDTLKTARQRRASRRR